MIDTPQGAKPYLYVFRTCMKAESMKPSCIKFKSQNLITYFSKIKSETKINQSQWSIDTDAEY